MWPLSGGTLILGGDTHSSWSAAEIRLISDSDVSVTIGPSVRSWATRYPATFPAGAGPRHGRMLLDHLGQQFATIGPESRRIEPHDLVEIVGGRRLARLRRGRYHRRRRIP